MGDHASNDIEIIAASLRGKFGTLYPLSKDRCIYRVPPTIRRSNEKLFTPVVVSIGPLHHDREELKAMEEHKLRYLQDFLKRTCITLEEFLTYIKDKETRLRDCYAETIKLGSQEFVEMMLLDAIFLFELLLRYSKSEFVTSEDRIFGKPWLIIGMRPDVLSVENQIPFFIIEDLFQFAKTKMPENQYCYEEVFMGKLVSDFCIGACEVLSIDHSLLETKFSVAQHFLDLLRLCVEPTDNVHFDNESESSIYPTSSPTVKKLHQAGIKLRVGSSEHLFDIRFDKGTLEIPKLRMKNFSMTSIRHLQIFEGLHCETNHINDYASFLSFLVSSPVDAELLIQYGIIENADSVEGSSFCQELGKNARVLPRNFKYSGTVRDLNAYCKFPWHKWKANLKQNYFNTPWASISVIAAVVLLVLTFMQTVCSILGLQVSSVP